MNRTISTVMKGQYGGSKAMTGLDLADSVSAFISVHQRLKLQFVG